MSLDFAACYPGFPLHVSLIGNPSPNFHLLLAHSNHLQVLCHPPFPQSIVCILAIYTLDGYATQRWCPPLSTTQRFGYSLHVSNSRLRRLIQQRCCYQDIFTHILLGLSGSNTHRRVRFISRTSSEALQLQCSRIAVPNIQMIKTFLEACQRLFGLKNSDGVVPILGD